VVRADRDNQTRRGVEQLKSVGRYCRLGSWRAAIAIRYDSERALHVRPELGLHSIAFLSRMGCAIG
jgi:hypothetical protein